MSMIFGLIPGGPKNRDTNNAPASVVEHLFKMLTGNIKAQARIVFFKKECILLSNIAPSITEDFDPILALITLLRV